MSPQAQRYLNRLAEALAASPLGEELLGVIAGDRNLAVRENVWGAGWIISTAPKPTTLPPLFDWRKESAYARQRRADEEHAASVVGATLGDG